MSSGPDMPSRARRSRCRGRLPAHACSILAALCLALPGVAVAQSWLDDRGPESQFLTLSEGLSDSTVFSIAQDEQGRVWFGTGSGGANVFDGHRIRALVNGPDPTSLSRNDAGQIFVDSKGAVYVGTWGGGSTV